MTDPERDEARLRALFDETASEADRMQLTRLRARAQDVPTRRAKRSGWRVFGSALALAAGALIVVFAQRGPHGVEQPARTEAPVTSVAFGRGDRPSAASAVSALPAVLGSAATESSEGTEPDAELPLAGVAFGDDSDDLLGPLYASSEDDADVWLSATDAFLEDG